MLLSHGLAARSQSCQTILGFINQVMSRVWASVSALALVPVESDLWEKPKVAVQWEQGATGCSKVCIRVSGHTSGKTLASAKMELGAYLGATEAVSMCVLPR